MKTFAQGLLSIILAIVLFAGCEGPVGPRGIQGEPGPEVESWDFYVSAISVSRLDTNWAVRIDDPRIQVNATYEVWGNLYDDGSAWGKLDLFWNINGYQFMMAVIEGTMILTTDEDYTGRTLRIFKIS